MSVELDRKSLWSALKGNVTASDRVEAILVESAWGQQVDQYPLNSLSVRDVGTLKIPLARNVLNKLKLVSHRVHDRVWSIKLSQLNVGLQKPSTSFSTTIAPMAEYEKAQWRLLMFAAKKLGIEPFYNRVFCKLHQLLLYDCGESVQPYTHEFDNQLEPDAFGVMMLQIPVEGGHSGGQLIVRHPLNDTTLDRSENSHKKFFLSASFIDCPHEIAPLTGGWSLVLSYHLVWKIPLPLNPNAGLSIFTSLLKRVRKLVLPWTNPPVGQPCSTELLVFPLAHDDPNVPLSYSNLCNKDKLISDLLFSTYSLELRLAVISYYETSTTTKNNNYGEDDGLAMDEDVSEEGTESPRPERGCTISRFRYMTGDKCSEKNLPIVWNKEYIYSVAKVKDIFSTSCISYQDEDELKHWFHQPVLIAWPQMSISVRCRFDFHGAVQALSESLSTALNSKDRLAKLWELEQIVTYCIQPKSKCTFQVEDDPNDPVWNHFVRSEPIWDTGYLESLLSLLDICYNLEASEQGLRLYYHYVHDFNWLDDDVMIHFANIISITEWADCRELLDVILFSLKPERQIVFSINLVYELLCTSSRGKVGSSKLFQLLSSQLFSSVPDCSTFDRIIAPLEKKCKMILLCSIFLLQVEGLLKDVALFSFTANHLKSLSIPDLNLFVKFMRYSGLFCNSTFRCLELRLQHLLKNLCHYFLNENIECSNYLLHWFELFDFVREHLLLQHLVKNIRASDKIGNRLLKSLADNEKFLKKPKFASIRNLLYRSTSGVIQHPGVTTRSRSRR